MWKWLIQDPAHRLAHLLDYLERTCRGFAPVLLTHLATNKDILNESVQITEDPRTKAASMPAGTQASSADCSICHRENQRDTSNISSDLENMMVMSSV
jgi:mono/diheme cytochrome c family protein